MGVCQSKEIQHQLAQSREIDKKLNADPHNLVQKLLLLGPGESGKSTVLKQMQILHANGFSEADIEERRAIVFSNTLTSMKAILEAMNQLDIPFEKPAREADAKIILGVIAAGKELMQFTNEITQALEQLWNDRGIQQCYEQRSVYQLNDSAKYFLDSVRRISDHDYRPTVKDVLHSRVATCGVVEVRFFIKNLHFRVFDVGGQRSERRKWIHCFDDVNAIIFVAAVSEYDQVLREDAKSNRVLEALQLFDNICNNAYFVKTAMVLFLNKRDLFEEKIKKVSLSVTFPSYQGGLNYEEGIMFLKTLFSQLNRDTKRKIYKHETCATDTDQLEIVISSVIDTIIQENLKESGML